MQRVQRNPQLGTLLGRQLIERLAVFRIALILPVDLCVVGRVSAVVHFETSGRSADVTVNGAPYTNFTVSLPQPSPQRQLFPSMAGTRV